MGLTNTILEIANAYNPSKKVKAEFLVDSGAFYTVLPKRLVEKLGIKPERTQEFSLADGTTIKRKMGSAFITFENRKVASPVIIGEAKDSALMGVLTLEALGLILNPFDRTLHPAKLML